MKIQDVLARVDELKPNKFSEEQKVRWLSNLELIAYEQVVRWHKDCEHLKPEPYDPAADIDAELMIEDPWSEVYVHWLSAQIDYYNGDLGRYQNSAVSYNSTFTAWANWFNRNHESEPKQLKVYGG